MNSFIAILLARRSFSEGWAVKSEIIFMKEECSLIQLVKTVFQPNHDIVYGHNIQTKPTGVKESIGEDVARCIEFIIYITEITISFQKETEWDLAIDS
jgi:hypothetical protein